MTEPASSSSAAEQMRVTGDAAKATKATKAANSAPKVRSFAGTTTVLMADGSRKPMGDVEVGDDVIATDPETA